MASNELINVLIRVVSSWQVIAATIALLIYLKLVLYVTGARRARTFDLSSGAKSKNTKAKKGKPAKAASSSEGDDLGIIEEE